MFPKELKVVLHIKDIVREIVHQYAGGLRAGMGYCGAKNIADLQECNIYKNHQCRNARKPCT